jgi:hypothetical protein
MSNCKVTPVPTAGPEDRVTARYADVRDEIRDGDVLLFRPRGLVWRLIAVAGRSQYTHASMAGWWHGRLMNVEMTSGGGRAQMLSNIVARWPGVIDVFTVDPARRFYRRNAVEAMIGITGIDYGRWNLLQAAFLHMPIVRCVVAPDLDDAAKSHWPPFCSQAVSTALRAGGVDPVPHLADRLTEPGDLARSAALQYRFTLFA